MPLHNTITYTNECNHEISQPAIADMRDESTLSPTRLYIHDNNSLLCSRLTQNSLIKNHFYTSIMGSNVNPFVFFSKNIITVYTILCIGISI